ncbi:MAG: sterol-binding protein [Gammaproteobacteria bacterium]|nr:sterol-binding protein [Gammaproteobacteria bacterium]
MFTTQLTSAMTLLLEVAINRVLQLDPDTMMSLQSLQGKVVAVELRGLNTTLFLIPTADGLHVFSDFDGEPDTVLSGTPVGLARMGLVKNTGDVFFEGDVTISGDVALGQKIQMILDGLDIDWEEHLSHFTGDVVAHKLGNLMRDARSWGQQTAATLSRDAAEYLQEESSDLPNAIEMDNFLTQVDTLRGDIDRTEARIRRLEKHIGQTGEVS